jgi:hypothetical protein
MLSASAKFIAPSIMSILSSAVAEYSVQAIFGSRKTVETVQSWMVVRNGYFGQHTSAVLSADRSSDVFLETASRQTRMDIRRLGWFFLYLTHWKLLTSVQISRAATEIGLDRTPVDDKLGASELQQRERRNQIRTWMLSFMMDRAMASATGRGEFRSSMLEWKLNAAQTGVYEAEIRSSATPASSRAMPFVSMAMRYWLGSLSSAPLR